MRKLKQKNNTDLNKSIDYLNFCNADNRLPILEIINERFIRTFRVSLSNHLRMITTISSTLRNQVFSEWVNDNANSSCMFIIRFNSLHAPILVKLDRSLAFGIIDILAGGTQKNFKQEAEKEFTMIDLLALKEISDFIISDLNEAWGPVEEIKAQYIRTEVNPQFVGIVPGNSKVKLVSHLIEFDKTKGMMEILYPYSMLFQVRDQLFTNE
jgi:flagellar motor switch protein FliM